MNIVDACKDRRGLLGNKSLSEGSRNLYSKWSKTAAGLFCNSKVTFLLFLVASLVIWANCSCLSKSHLILPGVLLTSKRIWLWQDLDEICHFHTDILATPTCLNSICMEAMALSFRLFWEPCELLQQYLIHDKCQNIFNSYSGKRWWKL